MPDKKKGTEEETKTKKHPKTAVKKASAKKTAKKAVKSTNKKVSAKPKKKSAATKKTVKKAAKTTAKKSTKKVTMARKRKRNKNLSKLCTEMNKLAKDAVDKEVTKRFKTVIDTSEEDITQTALRTIMKDSKNVDFSKLHESFHPYVKHYIFMLKRNSK